VVPYQLQIVLPKILFVLTLSTAIIVSVYDLFYAKYQTGLNFSNILAVLAPIIVVGAFWLLLLFFAPLFQWFEIFNLFRTL